jgi:hypothetical protein
MQRCLGVCHLAPRVRSVVTGTETAGYSSGRPVGYGIRPSASQAGRRVPFACEPSFGGWRLT